VDSEFFQGIKNFFSSSDEKKDLVDPYVVFSFAGKKVQSKILYNDANPEWNQELKIGLKVFLAYTNKKR
jgi:myoferlin